MIATTTKPITPPCRKKSTASPTADSNNTNKKMSKTVLRLFAEICSYTNSLETTFRAGQRRADAVSGTQDQNWTLGTSVEPCSASKNSRLEKLNIPATITVGNVWIFVLYFCTLSL